MKYSLFKYLGHNFKNLKLKIFGFLGLLLIIFVSFLLFCHAAFASELDVNKPEELKKNGITLYQNGYYEDALDCFFKIPLEKRGGDVFILIANCYESTGQKLRAVDTLKNLIEINPSNYKAYYNLGNIYFKNGEYKKSIELYSSTIILQRLFAPAYYNTGISYFEMKDFKLALKYFQKALEINPQDANYCYNTALTYEKLNKKKKAAKYFKLYKNISSLPK